MKAEPKKLLQALLLIAMALALVRLVVVFQQRRTAEDPAPERVETALPADFYVTQRKLYLHDLQAAQDALAGQTVWIREGYRYTFYPHARGRSNFAAGAGLLPPLARLEVREVVRQPNPGAPGDQIVAVFQQEGGTFALPIGTHLTGSYQIYADELFFYDDPRQMYKHWPGDVWQAIEQGEVRKGMNELQVSFAAGMGMPQESDPEIRIVRYPRGELPPLTVWFRNDRVIGVEKGEGGG